MKSTKNIVIGIILLALAACAGPTTNPPDTTVTIQVKFFTWTNSKGEVNYPTEFKIIGDFNNWGNNSGTDLDAVWSQAADMKWNETKGVFEATVAVWKGKPIKYTFVSKHINHVTKSLSFYGWETLENLYYTQSKEWIFSPFDELVDNGMGNGGKNAYYLVP